MRHSLIPILITVCVMPSAALLAQQDKIDEKKLRQQQLETIDKDLRAEQERLQRLSQEVETIKKDRVELNRQIVSTAQVIKQYEAQISAGEQRIQTLNTNEETIRASLKTRNKVITELLAALQRMGRNPPPALLVEPENALKAVRSAILLGAVLPEFTEEAKLLAQELEDLVRVRTLIADELKKQRNEVESLRENRTRLTVLLDARRKELSTSEEELARTRLRSQQLAEEAKSLRELIERSEKEIASAQRAAEAAAAADASRLVEPKSIEEEKKTIEKLQQAQKPEERTVAALANPGRLKPAISFDKTRGLLPLPVSGETVRRYGQEDSLGNASRGILIKTRKEAVVTAPADGWVAYAGPFRTYGNIVILNAGGGYHILLAGLNISNVDIGQFVLAGEPIGQMGQTKLQAATSIDLSSTDPVLYIEFRKDGSVIDPAPWWANTQEKVRG